MANFSDFVGDKRVTSFSEFYFSREEGIAIVIACYLGVEEGVDMWFLEDPVGFDIRFRLKVNVGTLESGTTFLLCDDVVRAIARDTFKTLMSLCESSSLYPIKLDGLFGDPLLFKVNKRLKGHDPSFIEYDILGVFSDGSLLEIFLDPNHSAYGSLGADAVNFVSGALEVHNVDELTDVSEDADHGKILESTVVESAVASAEIHGVKKRLLDFGKDLQCHVQDSVVGNIESSRVIRKLNELFGVADEVDLALPVKARIVDLGP